MNKSTPASVRSGPEPSDQPPDHAAQNSPRYSATARRSEWVPDILPGFEQLTLELRDDDEGPVVATLVRPEGQGEQGTASGHSSAGDDDVSDAGIDLLYVHGWCDYFFQTHLARFWTSLGVRFYALDLRKYGRSLRDGQTPGYVDSLKTYDEDIEAALSAIGHGAPAPKGYGRQAGHQTEALHRLPHPPNSLHLPARAAGGPHLLHLPGRAHEDEVEVGDVPLRPGRHRRGDDAADAPASAAASGSAAAPAFAPASGSAAAPGLAGASGAADGDRDRQPAAADPSRSQYSATSRPTAPKRRLILMGHSTGGLTLPLWLDRHPGRADALVLNSPWLEFQVGSAGRRALDGAITAQARVAPKSHLANVDLGLYARSISNRHEGEWDIDPVMRPDDGWGFPAGWLAAVFRGQERVAHGLNIHVPILTLMSARSTTPTRWHPEMMSADSVLNVATVTGRIPLLGSFVTMARFDGALHDVTLSAAPVRKQVWRATRRWFDGLVR